MSLEPKLKKKMNEQGVIDPSKSINTQETFRGFLTSLGNSLFISIIMTICKLNLKMDVQTIALLINTIMGNITSYSLDIMFAKKTFKLSKFEEEVDVSYKDFSKRFGWLINSYFSDYFIRFLIVAMIDGSIYLVALDYFSKILKRKNIKFKLGFIDQDILLMVFLPTFSFFLFVNQLRFRWAYSSSQNGLMSMLILFWFTVVILLNFIYFKNNKITPEEKNNSTTKPNTKTN